MKRKIRLRGTASLLFAALLLTVSLTACGGKTEPSSSETGSTASTQGTVSEASEVSEAPVSSGASDVSGTVSTGNAASKPPSNNDNNPNSSRGVASNAGTQWDPKNEIDLPDEIELQIKPVKDAVLHETPKDMGGKKFIFATFYPQYYTAGAEANATMRLDAIASIEKDYHCDIEIITLNPNTYANLINTAKASGQLYANII